MANDINMWGDIEVLVGTGLKEQAKALLDCYHFRYIEYDEIKLKKYKQYYIEKYGYIDNYV